MTRLRLALLAIAIGCTAAPVFAQDVTVSVATQEPPYYVGEPAVIQFTVEGFDEQPEPTCKMEAPVPGVHGRMAGASPSVFSQIVQRNGQIFRKNTITFRINYVVTADKSGEYTIGPFVLKQGNKEARVDSLKMTFSDVPSDPNMRVRLILPDGPIYPDQRVPVKVEWWYAGDFKNLVKLRIYSPLFDQFRFAPDEQASRDTRAQLPIDTKDGQVSLPAEAREEQYEGKRFAVISATRTLIPNQVGRFELAPITATVRRATQWTRRRSPFDDDFFGGSLFDDVLTRREPAKVEPARATGQPLTLVVRPFPVQDRPESFAGAVGAGFSIDVSADRTVVRVGDPIGLDVTLRGDGNIENASLPSLSADGGMSPDRFGMPKGDVPGTVTDGSKQFRVSVRVKDESVTEIPALAYSWFDPQRQTYQTAKSKPIALRVMPAKVISAGDVVRSGGGSQPNGGGLDPTRENGSGEVAAAPRSGSVFSLSGADLAIEPDADVVLRDSAGGLGSVAWQMVIYVAGLLLIGIAVLDRKRRDVDPRVTARQKLLREQVARIEAAASLAAPQAAEEIAAALRKLVAEFPDGDRDAAQGVIADCEAIAFSPASKNDERLDPALLERARALARGFQS